MQLKITLTTLLLSGGLSYASSLSVYRDSAIYTFQPETSFIGFGKGIDVKCKGERISLKASLSCPDDDRLCKDLDGLKKTSQKLKAAEANQKVLDTMISLPRPTSMDARAWIESSKMIGEEQAKLSTDKAILKEELALQTKDFKRQAPSLKALYTAEECKNELEVTLPYGQLFFSTFYEADIMDRKHITVTQYLSVTNKSGIDIQADNALFYYRPAHRYIRPVHFSPWIVSKYTPPQINYVKTRKAVAMDAEPMVEMMTSSAPAPAAEYLDAREYQISTLSLPSTGLPLDVKVIQWKTPLECDTQVYPYRSTTVFHTCSFTPKFQIDNNLWKVKKAETIINDKAAGEYREGKYILYTDVEPNIKVQRKPVVQRERTTGIFGGTARKKDGFTLLVTNKSDTAKTLTVTERIPTSATEEIKVKLLEVQSDEKVRYKLLKDGKIEIKLVLAAHENRKIDILFEISYDKDLKINY